MTLVVPLFARSLWLGLAGLYGARRSITAAATVFAMVVLALVLGAIDLHGPFGMQLVIEHRARGWGWDFHD